MNFSHHLQTESPEHPFAEIIRIIGKGKKGARSLTQEEAYHAMTMILNEQILPVQLGAFLMLMRIKEETPEELAGFVQAAQESITKPINKVQVDLDWSSYAGKRRHLPWFLLSAFLLVENGISILMHGSTGPSSERLYTEAALTQLGIEAAGSINEAVDQLRTNRFAYLPLHKLSPKLQEIIDLRPVLGLRSPMHTLVRMLNPLHADFSIQGIFHPSYRAVHQQAAALLKLPHMAVLKGEGGETERNPDGDCLVQTVHDGELSDENWPAIFSRRHIKPELLKPEQLALIWSGHNRDEFGEAAVIGTAAIALKLLKKADTQQQAWELANELWSKRNKQQLPVTPR